MEGRVSRDRIARTRRSASLHHTPARTKYMAQRKVATGLPWPLDAHEPWCKEYIRTALACQRTRLSNDVPKTTMESLPQQRWWRWGQPCGIWPLIHSRVGRDGRRKPPVPSPSSNRTCGFPASGFPEDVLLRRAQVAVPAWPSDIPLASKREVSEGMSLVSVIGCATKRPSPSLACACLRQGSFAPRSLLASSLL